MLNNKIMVNWAYGLLSGRFCFFFSPKAKPPECSAFLPTFLKALHVTLWLICSKYAVCVYFLITIAWGCAYFPCLAGLTPHIPLHHFITVARRCFQLLPLLERLHWFKLLAQTQNKTTLLATSCNMQNSNSFATTSAFYQLPDKTSCTEI